MTNNVIWRIESGFLAAYTEDKDLMRRIKRYKTKNGWAVTAEYYDTKTRGKLLGVHYRVPIEQRRQVMRMFEVAEIID